ncbi:uncharacterized protein LOC129780226 [Toxorhynchites rutilus septentrionalis]|uniref:uncharacterized protein LOC129780226 n=1 Tax=Toxorhynchites rutilus septentrionalis TaxID=329112 RepID=UPI00247B1F54|nr:uncharacterized protein LOC129780226 [Toxorhynchites rutilus septentrionalis]
MDENSQHSVVMDGVSIVEPTTESGNQQSSCTECRRPDSAENMVQCDNCDGWQHYTCAGVDDSVADRSWVCALCAGHQQQDDVASNRSESSRCSATSAFSVSLGQLVEKQQAERARADLALQRRHLEEQQQLIDNVLGGEAVSGEASGGCDNCVSSREVNSETFSGERKRPPTTPNPEAPISSSVRRSTPLLGVSRLNEPPMVSIPSDVLDELALNPRQEVQDPHAALSELRNRVERCERRANPTPEELDALRVQLERCRELLEGFQSGNDGSRNRSSNINQPAAGQLSTLAASKPLLEKQIGAIPKASRKLPPVLEGDQPRGHSATGLEESTDPLWPLRDVVSQNNPPVVSRKAASIEMRPEHMEPPGKRQALSHLSKFPSHNSSTTIINKDTREQSRIDARPGELYMPPTISFNQSRESLARPNESIMINRKIYQTEHRSTGEQTRETPPRTVDLSQYPRQSDNFQINQVMPPSRSVSAPSQQQLAARQSLAKELPRFSGDPADWPIFISNYRYTTEACGFSDGENMLRLQRCLTGPALETVRSRLVLPAAVPQVIETLRMRFGRPELLINALLRKVREIPAPRSDRLEGLIDFGMAVQALCDHIEAANERAHLSNPSLLQELVAKLPADQRMMWAGYKRGFQHVDLKTFGDYMASVVQDATSVVSFEPEVKKNSARDRLKNKGFVNTHATDKPTNSSDSPKKPIESAKRSDCLHCNQDGHRVRECGAFKQLTVDDRWRRVRALQLCQNCLFNHGRRACRGRKTCDIEGCQFRHHPLLHSPSGPPKLIAPKVQVAENHTHHHSNASTLFRIIPVTVYGKDGSLNTFAFLDEGSDLTLVENDLATTLGVNGTPHPLCLRWTGDTSRIENDSRQITIEIAGIGQTKLHKLVNARTVNNLGLPRQSFQMKEAVRLYPHLKGIPVSSYQNVKPKILIGIDNLRLALPLKIREGDGAAPVAVKTRLGWCVYGPRGNGKRESYSFHVCKCSCDEDLQATVKEFFEIESAGVIPPEPSLSKEDQRALTIIETTTKRCGNRFETGLVWKEDHVEFPDSYPMALRRLECLERRMSRDPELKENLHRQMREYEAKGYAHKAIPEELEAANPRRIWYLPVGAVVNPKKPGKIRMVWDAAAKVNGVSLNGALLKGPDQLSSLPGVLFRFRLYCIAVSSDVKEMFHQLRIRDEDKISQLFLWRNNPSEKPTVYMMDVATFGSTCSPASAQFIKNRNAEQYAELHPEAAKAIVHDHYVDDYLASFSSVEEAAKVASDVRYIHGKAGFNLHNWRSNSSILLQKLGEIQQEAVKQLNLVEGGNTERVLGMLWSPTTDELSFSTQMNDEMQILIRTDTRPTKRQVLRCVMTLFDPLGLLSPFIIHGKVLIQDLWREGTDWDEKVSDAVYVKWQRWIKMIEYISDIRIPRCYFSGATRITYQNSEVHVFVDASEVAYSCAVYLRTFNEEENPQCCLIAAKSKVAPLKPWSIPRLELQACVLGTRWAKFVVGHLDVPVTKVTYWTDSRTALAWIKSDPRNYRQFVSFRVGEILEQTTATQWKWVPSKSNPADEATKWGSGPYFNQDSKWFRGPNFLWLAEEEWPRVKEPVVATAEEMRASILHHCTIETTIDFHRFSTWERLQHATAYVLRFLNNASKKQPKYSGSLQQAELHAAEEIIIKLTQREAYTDEVAALSNKALNKSGQEVIGKNSSIYNLMPFLDDRGLLRERGRIEAAESVPHEVRHPLILPRKHHVTELLVNRYHRRYRHGNAETVVNELRQLYTIPRLRLVVKKAKRDCALCKIRRTRPMIPPMAPLPVARLAHHERPFTYTGLDYFGPLLVKLGRSIVKRWIALFTCLTVRAVHLEVAYTLSTESCISCVRRFVGRRGSPVEFFSDNGTNFKGAERVLQHQINQGLSSTFTSANTKWSFIPPGAPHMGGAWERLVQSVKAAMAEAYIKGKLDDEGLQTLVVEAENIVNSRPLTYLPLESEMAEALTPNHFLLLSSNGVKRRGEDVALGQLNDLVRRQILGKSWELIQRQLETFWQRWLVEYLPVIRRQAKWFDEVRALEPGDVVVVAEPTKRSGWERGRIIRMIPNPDGRCRRAVVQIGGKSSVRPVTRLALLDVVNRCGVPEDSGLHPGETVNAEFAELATLSTGITEGANRLSMS